MKWQMVWPVGLFLWSGCGSIEGDWAGELTWLGEIEELNIVHAFEFKITKDKDEGRTYKGDGERFEVGEEDQDIEDCKMTFFIEVQTDSRSGEQDVDIELGDCKWSCPDLEQVCPEIKNAAWDGENTIEMDLVDERWDGDFSGEVYTD